MSQDAGQDLPYLTCPPLTDEGYRAWFTDTARWRPYVRWVAARHGQPVVDVRPPSEPGSHPVFATGGGCFVKFYAPHWPYDAAHERLAYRLLESVPSTVVPRPPVLGWGELYQTSRRWPWPYVLVGALPGRPVGGIWHRLSPTDRMALAQAVGRVVRAVHGIGSGDVAALLARRSARRLRLRRREAVQGGLAARRWPALNVDAFDRYWERAFADAPVPCLTHQDLTGDHVLVDTDTPPRLVGIFDWGDAGMDDPSAEMPALFLSLFNGDRTALRAFRDGYGDDGPMFAPGWQRRATLYLLISPFSLDNSAKALGASLGDIHTPDDLEQALWA
jgi:hypothetical protein